MFSVYTALFLDFNKVQYSISVELESLFELTVKIVGGRYM